MPLINSSNVYEKGTPLTFRYGTSSFCLSYNTTLNLVPQDMASRFTLDSASEFLFGKDVHSLSAGLPYPYDSEVAQSAASIHHSSNQFAYAFAKGQNLIAMRTRYGLHWPLVEFWEDRARTKRLIVDKFIEPILDQAIAKNKVAKQILRDTGKAVDGETLLDHLVNFTDGKRGQMIGRVMLSCI